MENDNRERLARVETKVDALIDAVKELKQTVDKHATACPACRLDLIERINKVKDECKDSTHKMSLKIVGIIVAVSLAGGGIGTYLSKIIGLIG